MNLYEVIHDLAFLLVPPGYVEVHLYQILIGIGGGGLMVFEFRQEAKHR